MDLSTQKELLKEWNNFGFKFVEKSDYQEILAHLHQNFYKDEPLGEVLGITQERVGDLDERITDILNLQQGSIYAYPLNDPTKVGYQSILIFLKEKTENETKNAYHVYRLQQF